MQFSEEWKSLFPISPVHKPPLLLSKSVGPLLFNPVPGTQTVVLSSSSHLTPPVIPPPPSTSLPDFLATSTSRSFAPVLRSTAAVLSPSSDHHDFYRSASRAKNLLHNRLEPLYRPNGWVLVFFPTGSNLSRVGFIVLSVRDSNVVVLDFPVHGSVFTSPVPLDHRIVGLAACPFSSFGTDDVGDDVCAGFLMVSTMYSVHWFRITIGDKKGGPKETQNVPRLVHMGSKFFKSSAVAHACWNPHLPNECVVLLQTGVLFMFDMDDSHFKGKRMSFAWDEMSELVSTGGWFSCDFSWHPRILVVANSKAVLMVDFRFGRCQPCCLLKIEMQGLYWPEKDQFVAFSKAGNDGFSFVVASKHWLLLLDVRKPLMPLLRWTHNLPEPSYLTVLPIHQLRSHPLDEKYAEIPLEGSGVILGSFWNNEFNIFCYGRPHPTTLQPFCAKMSKISGSIYAWELPSELLLSGQQNCGCGSCLLQEGFAKYNLPEWVEWQQKKVMVLGFFFLGEVLSSSLPTPGEHGGFTLVRLMSSGKIETQQYCASWKMARLTETPHRDVTLYSRDSLLCSMGDVECKYPNKYKHVDLKYLYGHLKDNLARILFSKYKNTPANGNGEDCSNEHLCRYMRALLKSYACDPPLSHLSRSDFSCLPASDFFEYVKMPTSVHEIVGNLLWIEMPLSILESSFYDFNEVITLEADKGNISFEAPPFLMRSPSSHGLRRPVSGLISPVVPLPASFVLSEISKHGYAFVAEVNECLPEEAITLKCKSVMSSAKKLDAYDSSNKCVGEYVVSLKEDKDESWDRPLYLYEPCSFAEEGSSNVVDEDTKICVQEVERFNTVVAKLAKNGEGKLFDELCPVALNFGDHDDEDRDVVGDELNAYMLLKKQFSQWQCNFTPYKDLSDGLKSK